MDSTFIAPSPRALAGPARFLLWLVARQRGRVVLGAALGTAWMLSLALPPYVLSRAIDDGLQARDFGALSAWAAALFGIGALNAGLGIARHRTMTKVRMSASFTITEATVRQCASLGAALSRRISAGEVVTVGTGDVRTIAQSLTVTGPGVGAVVAYLAVAVVMFSISPLLAIVVLAGVPLLALAFGPLLSRVQRVGSDYRAIDGALTTRLVDVVNGLRVLNGFGGKREYAERFGHDSQKLQHSGFRVGAAASWVDALAIGMPSAFLAVVTWLAARLAAEGSISVGDLVAVYGYSAVLAVPVASFIESAGDIARAMVAARRVLALLNIYGERPEPTKFGHMPTAGAVLRDPASGVGIRSGVFTALVSASSAEGTAIIDRLGRFTESDVVWGDVRLDTVSTDDIRERITVADNSSYLFEGSVRAVLAGRHAPDDERLHDALRTAVATEIVDALPDGLDSVIHAQGQNLSGGQQQRIRLARALYGAPKILLAVEPTSSVDAHTESAIAARLRSARSGMTTVVLTTSPLVLSQADVVLHVVNGRVAATGTHADLVKSDLRYRAVVSHEEESV